MLRMASQKLIRIASRFIHIGIPTKQLSVEDRKVKLVNQLIFMGSAFAIAILLLDLSEGDTSGSLVDFITILLVNVPILLNYIRLRKAAQRYAIVSLIVSMCATSLLYGPQLGSILGLLTAGLMVFIFCQSLNEKIAYWTALLGTFFVVELTVNAWGAPFANSLSYFSYVLLVVSNFGSILLIGFYFKREQELAQDLQQTLLEDLSEQDAVLQAQNARLSSQVNEIGWIHQELERFSYATSHHFRTPLRSINNFMDLIERELEGQENPQLKLYLRYVKQSSQMAYKLMEDTLTYIRIAREEPLCEYIDLNQIFEEVRKEHLPLIQSKQALVISRVLPKVWGMKSHMRQLFSHLIQNAVQYNNQEVPKLIISATQNRKFIQLQFKDNGIGISPDFQQQIFEVFTRLSTSEDSNQTGIGLAICQKIVYLAKGKIHLQSHPGRGSTFTVHYPLRENRPLPHLHEDITSISNGSSYLN
ncbi:MAG: ATP-binding protein [Bacteroidota bacterium]